MKVRCTCTLGDERRLQKIPFGVTAADLKRMKEGAPRPRPTRPRLRKASPNAARGKRIVSAERWRTLDDDGCKSASATGPHGGRGKLFVSAVRRRTLAAAARRGG